MSYSRIDDFSSSLANTKKELNELKKQKEKISEKRKKIIAEIDELEKLKICVDKFTATSQLLQTKPFASSYERQIKDLDGHLSELDQKRRSTSIQDDLQILHKSLEKLHEEISNPEDDFDLLEDINNGETPSLSLSADDSISISSCSILLELTECSKKMETIFELLNRNTIYNENKQTTTNYKLEEAQYLKTKLIQLKKSNPNTFSPKNMEDFSHLKHDVLKLHEEMCYLDCFKRLHFDIVEINSTIKPGNEADSLNIIIKTANEISANYEEHTRSTKEKYLKNLENMDRRSKDKELTCLVQEDYLKQKEYLNEEKAYKRLKSLTEELIAKLKKSKPSLFSYSNNTLWSCSNAIAETLEKALHNAVSLEPLKPINTSINKSRTLR